VRQGGCDSHREQRCLVDLLVMKHTCGLPECLSRTTLTGPLGDAMADVLVEMFSRAPWRSGVGTAQSTTNPWPKKTLPRRDAAISPREILARWGREGRGRRQGMRKANRRHTCRGPKGSLSTGYPRVAAAAEDQKDSARRAGEGQRGRRAEGHELSTRVCPRSALEPSRVGKGRRRARPRGGLIT
jgi:hypothetical protein